MSSVSRLTIIPGFNEAGARKASEFHRRFYLLDPAKSGFNAAEAARPRNWMQHSIFKDLHAGPSQMS